MGVKSKKNILLLLFALFGLAGCVTDEDAFTSGRLQTLCNESTPICNVQASCTLDNSHYLEGSFPGGLRLLVRSERGGAQLILRMFFTEMIYPGAELLVQAYDPGCGDHKEEHLENIDPFELAGDDRVLQFELDLPVSGDHLLEIFSDMSAEFLLTAEIIER